MTIHEKLLEVQANLKAPKSQTNSFGKYRYRSCEDILEAVKPHLEMQGLVLTLSDEIVMIGTRFYVKATALVSCRAGDRLGSNQEYASVTAYAREEEAKKGMDGSQITGAASSYARKYALNGLFLIDDTKDSDATNQHEKEAKPEKWNIIAEKKTPVPLITDPQIHELKELLESLTLTLKKDVLEANGWVWPLTEAQATSTIQDLKKRLDKKLNDAAQS